MNTSQSTKSNSAERSDSSRGQLFAQLENVRVALRSDLQITRQIQEGNPVYVVHDPVGFRTHRLTQQDYEVATRLDEDTTLGKIFTGLVEDGILEPDDEETFYTFVGQLQKLALISVPGTSGAKLYEAWQSKRKAARTNRVMRFLFIRVPLADPDRFLTRTERHMRFLFTRAFFIAWLIAGAVTLGFLVSRWRDFIEPFNDYLALTNLPLLWTALIVLKIWHEFGHGYACKTFGGKVPEMGMLLLGGNPAAYVDATAAWSFERRRHRLIVMLGGMYFESLAAIIAVYVWAMSTNPVVSSWAHYVITLSTTITVLFNANPLMRFDGYFIFSELVGIQNLRPRAVARVKAASKRAFLGIPDTARHDIAPKRRALLMSYGVASSIYKTLVMLGIAVAFSMRFPVVGLLFGIYFFGIIAGGMLFKLGKYLLTSEEVQPVRWRARAAFAIVFFAIPALLFVIPVPFGIQAEGLQGADVEHYLYSEAGGELQEVHVEAGQTIDTGDRVLTLANPDVGLSAHVASVELQQARQGWEYLHGSDSVKAARMESRVQSMELELASAHRTLSGLSVRSPLSGTVARLMVPNEPGQFIRNGQPTAIVVSGSALVRAWLTEEQLDRIAPKVGDTVDFRLASRPMDSFAGRIIAIRPMADDLRDELALTQIGGGSLVVQADSGKPMQPLFAVEIEPTKDLDTRHYGTRASVRFPRQYEPIARWAFRRCLRFVQKSLQS